MSQFTQWAHMEHVAFWSADPKCWG